MVVVLIWFSPRLTSRDERVGFGREKPEGESHLAVARGGCWWRHGGVAVGGAMEVWLWRFRQ